MTTTLTLYNTLTRTKESFAPLDAERLRMYVCGPTVYARPHLGNARSVAVYDVLYRLLRHLYGKEHVTYVRNITDVDDKINRAAMENGETIQALTARVTGWFHDDMDALNCLRPTHEPRATQYIPHMIAMIQKLIANGHAYAAEGHVLFDVASQVSQETRNADSTSTPALSPAHCGGQEPVAGALNNWHYGMLSGRKTEEQQAGARVAVESYKRHPGDFVLWKPADAEDDASSTFESPWGMGRPGWHIECSAMATDLLGETFDIHGGGADLKFPHHENEIAQSCCANPGSEFAKCWVHNGFLTVNGEKMAKSLGNFITVRDLLDKGVQGEVIRFALLSTKYSDPLNWTDKLLDDARKTLDKWYRQLPACPAPEAPASAGMAAFVAALADDLNVPKAISLMHGASEEELPAMGRLLGLFAQAPDDWFGRAADTGVDALVAARTAAKAAKNWAEADRIRDELKAQGIILEDRPDGTTGWRKA